MIRPSWDTIWETVAYDVLRRSLCSRAQVGAVIVDDENRVVATGYNGPAAGFEHQGQSCQRWCPRGSDPDNGDVHPCLAVHAEANALLMAGRIFNGTMYVTKHPCWECAKLIANSGITRLVVKPHIKVEDGHHSEETYFFLTSVGIVVEVLPCA